MRYLLIVFLWIFVVNLAPNEKFWDPEDKEKGTRAVTRDFLLSVFDDIETGIVYTVDGTYDIKVREYGKLILFVETSLNRTGFWVMNLMAGGSLDDVYFR
ncbi:MAG: hypothetical protein F4207_13925 [Gemmatimonadetes bacterium]|nr:hypothetical protein [Gemmatimonadota bacterium]MYA76337.1 hypothetical protein [Gemmatimonadota bacterium]MYG17498.1 hypothetical protein [Gemmatimonadota bacterium]MYH20319.1 hypothetical protein [Gemmatimonadota bacterium]MYK97309.1 hypothetical protein [Gemmatimonadota bacterium]